MVVVDPMRNLPMFSGEKTESADNHLDVFDDYLEIQQINVADANVAQIITRFGKAKKWFNQCKDGRPHATVADWNALKEQLKQQFNPLGNIREEQMTSWRNIKWDGNETLDEFSYRFTQLGKVLGLNDQHILDSFKLGLLANIYVNLVSIAGMQATSNMAKRLMAVSKGTTPGASSISNIPFMVASSHDGLASGIYQKPDIPKQGTFQDSALLSGLQKINKKLESLDNDLYALRAETNERSRREYKSPGKQKFRSRNMSGDNSRDSSRDSQERDRRISRRSNRSRNKSRNNSGDRLNDRARNGRNDSKQKSNRHCNYCDQDGHTWKCCWENQANAKKARRLKGMDDRDDDPSDTFNSMVSDDPISDDDLDGFIRNFSDMTELN